jgi:peptide/nickel transport system substrate-binding protein
MRHITFLFRAGSRPCLLVAAFLILGTITCVSGGAPSTRPRAGGILRVQIHERIDTIDPRRWPSVATESAAAERVDSLVFDRLLRLDDHGTPQPALAVSWQHDAQQKRWQFRLRDGVKFSEGTPLTSEVTALSLQQLLGNQFDVSATSDSVVIQAGRQLPDLSTQLATGHYFIFHIGEDGSMAGTGPFRYTLVESAGRAAMTVLFANESCWAGRPFVDEIHLSTNVDFEQQVNAIAFGQANVVELPASQVRRATQRGVRTVSSDPVELLALQLDVTRPAIQDIRIRQSISLAIDRTSIADVILQRQGIAAGSLLPNWISGYTHLFPVSLDVPRAKDLLAASGHELSRPAPLVLVYDSSDTEARAVADRVAVNLREVGIMVQVMGQNTGARNSAGDMRLVRHHIASPDSAVALSEMLNSLGEAATDMGTPEQIYAAERAPIDTFRIIPLVHVSESYGLSPQVRDWMPPRWGGWRLEDVWLDQPAVSGGAPQ